MKPILEVRNLSKEYQIGRQKERYKSLRDSISSSFSNPFKKNPTIWALKDVSFDIFPGESIGIIGKNGAGKSTLLKIISKITPPTKGYIKARGRVASLLEVGTGFHPELTGRENVFLNGAILGLRRQEIKSKFDEIIAFSGVETFIDTPLKHFSTGMQLRLAFAVAAFLESEILVIDEVLAVGDAEFQKKCLGKMKEVSQEHGRTVLFVSHDLNALQKICKRGILINEGEVSQPGDIKEIVATYLNSMQIDEKPSVIEYAKQSKGITITKIEIADKNDIAKSKFSFGEPFCINLKVDLDQKSEFIYSTIGVDSMDGKRIFTARSQDNDRHYKGEKGESIEIKATFDVVLVPGIYKLLIRINKGRGLLLDQHIDALNFEVTNLVFKDTIPFSGGFGVIRVLPIWE